MEVFEHPAFLRYQCAWCNASDVISRLTIISILDKGHCRISAVQTSKV